MAMTCVRISANGKICGGEIEDGICGSCGRPQISGQFQPPAPPRGEHCENVMRNGQICGGKIEDGVCGSCGKVWAVAKAPAAQGRLSPAGAKCDNVRDGNRCDGVIEDGLCAVCGKPQGAAPTPPAPGSYFTPAPAIPLNPDVAQAAPRAQLESSGQSDLGGRRSKRRHSVAGAARRQPLGGGLVAMAPAPSVEPEKLIMATPEVPLARRRCSKCDAQVYRMSGFCGQCATPYDFRPTLKAGDMLAKKYEIKGPIAFGGMGWIYLGWDTILSRWIVVKGLLDAADEEAAAAAMAERRFLAAVKHGKIVSIYDFVAQGAQGFLVIEFVGGQTIESLREARDIVDVLDATGAVAQSGVRRDTLSPAEKKGLLQVVRSGVFTPEEAISYILGTLRAFGYLHAQGFVYCDFKPENLMLDADDVKLIDLGAVRRIGDNDGSVFATDGFCSKDGMDSPTPLSDIYTIGRSLACLLMDFLYKSKVEEDKTTKQFAVRRLIVKRFKDALPSPEEQPVLAQHDSLYRFLLRATHEDPDHRFQSVEEMEGQLFGVLREIAARGGGPKPAESRVFGADRLVDGADRAGASAPLARLLPTLRLSATDAAAGDILALASVSDPTKRIQGMAAVVAKNSSSVEAKLRYADALMDAGMYPESLTVTDALLQQDAFEWRAHWYAGKALLADGRPAEARERFDRVYFEMPGELAPKLGLAFAYEAAGDHASAAAYYGRVAMVDPSHGSACFGLSRCLRALGDVEGAVKALDAVPASHSLYAESRLALARFLVEVDHRRHKGLLQLAADRLAAVAADGGLKHQLAAALLETAAKLIESGDERADEAQEFLGVPMTEPRLRLAAEAEYRAAGRQAVSVGERQMWVDMANRIRPRTLT